jgi:hypothetical protein
MWPLGFFIMPRNFDGKSRFQRLDFNENHNVGVLCRTNEDVAFIQRGLSKKIKEKVISALDVTLVELPMQTLLDLFLQLIQMGQLSLILLILEILKLLRTRGWTCLL